MKPHRPYELQEYDPEWKTKFSEVAEELRPILGMNLVDIEHIGSTSIPGMVAKPQIDVLVIVKDLEQIKNCYKQFEAAGFTVKGRGYVNPDDEYVHKDSSDGKRLFSVHIFQEGNERIRDYQIFRDYLKENIEDRNLYISTKKNLYSLHSQSYHDYNSGKTEVIDGIQSRAKAWAQAK